MSAIIDDAVEVNVSSVRRGRKALSGVAPATAVHTAEAEVLESAAAPVMAELRASSVTLHKGELTQSLKVSQAVGSIKAFQFSETVNRVALLRQLSGIRESRAYKGATLLDSGGQPVMVQTWEEFCKALGYSDKKIDEDLRNLAIFGGSLLEAQEALGLGYRDLRLLRAGIKALPPEEQQKVLDDLQSVEGSDEAQEKLDELRVKLAETEMALKSAKEDMAAKETVSKAKSVKIDKLNEQIAKLTSLPLDEQQRLTATKALEARKQLDTACHQVVGVLDKVLEVAAGIMADPDIDMETKRFMHARVALMCDLLSESILHTGIDVDFSTRFTVDYGPEGDPVLVPLAGAGGTDGAGGTGDMDTQNTAGA